MKSMNGIKVTCYSGFRGEERPTRFEIWEREVHVTDILDQWVGPDHRYFKVKGDDDAIYILRYDLEENRWDLSVYSKR